MRVAALLLGIVGGGLGSLLSVSSLADEFSQSADLAAGIIALVGAVAFVVGLVSSVQVFRGSRRSSAVMVAAGGASVAFLLLPEIPIPQLSAGVLLVIGGALGWQYTDVD